MILVIYKKEKIGRWCKEMNSKLAKRIIPCLDIQNGRVAKGTRFKDVKEIGDPVLMAINYQEQGADELVFYDIHASVEKRGNFLALVTQIANHLSIPFMVGGGIGSEEDVYKALCSGADKVSINSAGVKTPELLRVCANQFGNQSIVASMDVKMINGEYMIFTQGGRNQTTYKASEWARKCESLGAGELVINAIDQDGLKNGYDILLMKQIVEAVHIPIIASGGAGECKDFIQVFQEKAADGALAASVFHYGGIQIQELKKKLREHEIIVR